MPRLDYNIVLYSAAKEGQLNKFKFIKHKFFFYNYLSSLNLQYQIDIDKN